MRIIGSLLLLIATFLRTGARTDESCSIGAHGNLAMSTPSIEVFPDGARISIVVFSDDSHIQQACPHWTVVVTLNADDNVSLDLCSCDVRTAHSASCSTYLAFTSASPEITAEALLGRKESITCAAGVAWVRSRSVVPRTISDTVESLGNEEDTLRHASHGRSAMNAICGNLSKPAGQEQPDPGTVLVTAADSLLPQTVTAVPELLRALALHAPDGHVVLCNVGPDDLRAQIDALTSPQLRARLSIIEPEWSSVTHFARVLGFRSVCMAAALCIHQTAIWVDTDLTLQGAVTPLLHQLSHSSHWLMTAHQLSISCFGFSRGISVDGWSAFDELFLPFFGETLAALQAHQDVWQGKAGSGTAGAGDGPRDKRERTVAGALERRLLEGRVASAQRAGKPVEMHQCNSEAAAVWAQRDGLRSGRGCGGGGQREATLAELMRVAHTDKLFNHAYDRYYARRLEALRDKEGVRVLELGGADGRSLDVWLNFFSAPAAVHVLTLDEVPAGEQGSREWVCKVHGAARCEAVRFFFGDQGDEELMETVLRSGAGLQPGTAAPHPSDEFWRREGGYDLIIDDASHYPPLQIFSMSWLLPALRPGGCFIMEDLETSFWNAQPTPHIYGRWLHGAGVGMPPPGNAVAKLKELVEVLFRWHMYLPHNLSVLGEAADAPLFALSFGAGLAILDRATVEESLHVPRMSSMAPWKHTLVDPDAVAAWAAQARETNPF